jgi:hypothetical protein
MILYNNIISRMFNLCQYKDVFGQVGKGIHSYRIFGIAYMDAIFTIIGAIILSWIMKWNYIYTIIGLFVLGIGLHHIFCVRTTVDKLLFPNS